MCTVCGCGTEKIEGHDHDHPHDHSHDHPHDHSHPHDHDHGHHHHHGEKDGDLHFGKGIGGTHVPGLSQKRIVQIEQDILGKNDHQAAHNRVLLEGKGVFTLNLVSSPGAGKTTLLTQTLMDLKSKISLGVIEGDQQTSFDAERIRETGVPALQVNTGKGCHLDADMVARALDKFAVPENGILFIENVGNLVCPAAFDLGEAHKVAILSVTEGEDKPLKYPDMFAAADLMILNKIDLLPYVKFDVERCISLARRVKNDLQIIQLSATSGEGMQDWYDWLDRGRQTLLQKQANALEARLATLKANMTAGT